MSETNKSENAGGRVVGWLLLGLVVLFGGGYVATQLWIGDKVPQGAQVLGTEIGGSSSDDARAEVLASATRALSQPVTLDVGGTEHEVTPADWGITIDPRATVEAAGAGQSWSPGRVWDYFTSGSDVRPVLDVDTEKFDAELAKLNDEVGTAATNATVSFKDGKVVTTEPRDGHGVDADSAQQAILDTVVDGKADPVELNDVAPRIGTAQVDRARDDFADNAMSAPVTVSFGETSIELTPQEFGKAITMVSQGDELVPELDRKVLDRVIKGSTSYKGKPVDATVAFKGGKPVVVPAKPGVSYDADELNDSFLTAAGSSTAAERSIKVEAVTEQAAFTTKDAEALGIKEKISTFTTEFPYAEYRNINIGRAAELVNGTVLKPGGIFSLNDIVGERTRENGFTEGFMIADGVFRSDLGGGVSQMATTSYNAGFFAGYKDIEHRAHSFYISRYPEGREATVAWGSLDMRFQNDTEYGALVRSYLKPATPGTQGSVTVEIWSTKKWDISTTTSPRYNFRGYKTRYITGGGCEPNSGWSGFDVEYTRVFKKPGADKVAKTEKYHTAYTPSDTVVCGPPPAPKAPAKPSDTAAE